MPTNANEIQITRVYDAPVKLVWEAWTDLAHVVKWWGPRGFTLTTKSKDFRPGGKWIYTMHGPDGTDYPNIATYHEIVPFERLVYDHGGNEERDKLFTVVATFKEVKGKTTLTMTMGFPTAEEAQATKQHIKVMNGYSTWDRLAEYLDHEQTGADSFVIARSFDADIKTVYEMWADPEHLARWLPPVGATMEFTRADVRAGGAVLWTMSTGDGKKHYGKIGYKELTPPHRIAYTQNFCDEAGNLCKPSFIPNYPDMVLTTVTLAEEGADGTRVSVRWEIAGEATQAERETFHGMKSGMTGGWNGSFDKLEALLSVRA